MAEKQDLWPQFRELVGLGDEPEEAATYLAQDAVIKLQEATEYLVTQLVESTKQAADRLDKLTQLREAIAMAYNALLMKNTNEALKELRKVITV